MIFINLPVRVSTRRLRLRLRGSLARREVLASPARTVVRTRIFVPFHRPQSHCCVCGSWSSLLSGELVRALRSLYVIELCTYKDIRRLAAMRI